MTKTEKKKLETKYKKYKNKNITKEQNKRT